MAAVTRLHRALATARSSSPGLNRDSHVLWKSGSFAASHLSRLPSKAACLRTSAGSVRRGSGRSRTVSTSSSARRNVTVMAGVAEKKAKKEGEEDFTFDGGEHPDFPWPRNYQQTLSKSFTVGGIGLHTGEYVTVRVMPAYAGEGRYFVRVPEGTNAHLYNHNPFSLKSIPEVMKDEEVTPEEEEQRTRLFIAYLEAQESEDDPFEGSFNDYVTSVANRDPIPGLPEEADGSEEHTHDEIQARSESEDYMLADLDNANDEYVFCTVLENSKMRLFTVEHLLSALEGCAIDNARIEVEGGEEMPVIDGSALGWTMQIQMTGLRPAPKSASDPEPVLKMVPRPQKMISVTDGDKFITLYPGELCERLTYGIDFRMEAPVIGKQWFTWSRREDEHYAIAVGSARTFASSLDMVDRMMQAGYIKGGTRDCALVANGDDWLDTTMIRHPIDEPARHKMLDLIGDLSLLASSGNQALPMGHIVAYKAGHALHLEFARALREACSSPDDWVPALPWDLSIIKDEIEAAIYGEEGQGEGDDDPSNN